MQSDVLVFADEIRDDQLKVAGKHSPGVNSSILNTTYTVCLTIRGKRLQTGERESQMEAQTSFDNQCELFSFTG